MDISCPAATSLSRQVCLCRGGKHFGKASPKASKTERDKETVDNRDLVTAKPTHVAMKVRI
jgi:hypothetical protein